MKKIIIIVMALFVSFGLFACGGNSTSSTETTATTAATTATTVPQGVKGHAGDFTYYVPKDWKAVSSQYVAEYSINGGQSYVIVKKFDSQGVSVDNKTYQKAEAKGLSSYIDPKNIKEKKVAGSPAIVFEGTKSGVTSKVVEINSPKSKEIVAFIISTTGKQDIPAFNTMINSIEKTSK